MSESPPAFLGHTDRHRDGSGFRVIPFALEHTVSWGRGTARGPAAILAASQEVELYDMDCDCEPDALFHVETLAAAAVAERQQEALEQIAALVEASLDDGLLPVVLGGEHGLTPGAVRPLARRHESLLVVQLDAHADLRDGYNGEHFSHASAMRRCLDDDTVEVLAAGIRSMCQEDRDFSRSCPRHTMFQARELSDPGCLERIGERVEGRDIYLSIDVDVFDSGLMPATGTPEPGGTDWWQTLDLLRLIATRGRIRAFDVVELAPVPGMPAPDFLAALLVYRLMTLIHMSGHMPGQAAGHGAHRP